MKTIDSLIPGSPAWLKSRSASKAPAMMGASRYQTRSDLLKQMATGMTKDVDAGTQRLFDAGHASEAAAREIAEDILCDGLSPVCGESDGGYLTASFDGLTFDGKIGFEHKLWRDDLAAAVRAGTLPEEYMIQMDQQILVGGLDYVLFMVSDGTREKCISMEYRSTPKRAAKLLAGWKQFDSDLAAYQHTDAAPEVTAAPQLQLPAVSIQVNGSIALIDNLAVFGEALTAYVAKINQKPETDQDFADLDATVKTLKTAEDALTAAENGALAQTPSIDQMRRQVAQYKEIARVARLAAEKTVKAEKENRRAAIVLKASKALANHIAGLNTRLGKPYMPQAHGDFSGAIKGLKTITSIQNACDTELARCKIESNEIADQIQENIVLLDGAKQHNFLFSDAATLVMKQPDDLALVIKSRISEHNESESKRLEAEREKIRAEEEAKAAAKVKAEQEEAERQRRAEEVARMEREANESRRAVAETKSASEQADATIKAAAEVVQSAISSIAQAAVSPMVVGIDLAAPGADKTVIATHTGMTGSARLLDRLDDLARQMTEAELSDLCIHAAHILENRRAAA